MDNEGSTMGKFTLFTTNSILCILQYGQLQKDSMKVQEGKVHCKIYDGYCMK